MKRENFHKYDTFKTDFSEFKEIIKTVYEPKKVQEFIGNIKEKNLYILAVALIEKDFWVEQLQKAKDDEYFKSGISSDEIARQIFKISLNYPDYTRIAPNILKRTFGMMQELDTHEYNKLMEVLTTYSQNDIFMKIIDTFETVATGDDIKLFTDCQPHEVFLRVPIPSHPKLARAVCLADTDKIITYNVPAEMNKVPYLIKETGEYVDFVSKPKFSYGVYNFGLDKDNNPFIIKLRCQNKKIKDFRFHKDMITDEIFLIVNDSIKIQMEPSDAEKYQYDNLKDKSVRIYSIGDAYVFYEFA